MDEFAPSRRAAQAPFLRLAAFLLGAGALGVTITSVLYALAGPAAAMPGGATTLGQALMATPAAASPMRAAGLIGMPSDVLLAVGALMFAMTRKGPSAAATTAGWLALAVAGLLFVGVDALVSCVLPSLVVSPPGIEAYRSMRALFEGLFAIGTWTAGAGSIGAAWPAGEAAPGWRAAGWSLRAAGALGLAGSTAFALGWPGAWMMGPGVALGAVALVLVSVANFRSPDIALPLQSRKGRP